MSKKNLVEMKDFSVFYNQKQAIKNCSVGIAQNTVTAIIGPSGCGKSSLLRSINRMNDFVDGFRAEGEILVGGENIYDKKIDVIDLRRKVGMVFQKPNPFPKSIAKNVLWGPKINYLEGNYQELLEKSLRQAALWDEVKDRLNDSALTLSGGQQQRLCIARTLAMNPEVILMDEPCSALDPIATEKIEQLILELRQKYTIVIVTHNMQQAARISDHTLFFYAGEMIEGGVTENIFKLPKQQRTKDYVAGLFG